MLIAIADDGISTLYSPELKVRYDLAVTDFGEVGERIESDLIQTNHGTTSAQIISKYVPSAEFCSLKIFNNDKLMASCDRLVAALEWCYKRNIPIIHLSVGSSLVNDYWKIRPIIAKMIQNKQVIVAAYSNKKAYSIPASLAGVFGVVADDSLCCDGYRVIAGSPHTPRIAASSRHRIKDEIGRIYETQITNSYAAPTVTAALHRILEQYVPLSLPVAAVHAMLLKNETVFSFAKPDFIEDAIVINQTGIPLLREHMFFNCVAEYQEILYRIEEIANTSLVYLPSKRNSPNEDAMALSLIKKTLPEYISLLYGADTSATVNGNTPMNQLFWSEPVSGHFSLIPEGTVISECKCPVVHIHGEEQVALTISCKLRDRLISEDYQCTCISNIPYSYLYGFDFLPNGDIDALYIRNATAYYDPDILLVCEEATHERKVSTSDELHLYVVETQESRIDFKTTDNSLQYDICPPDPEAIFERIIEHFS